MDAARSDRQAQSDEHRLHRQLCPRGAVAGNLPRPLRHAAPAGRDHSHRRNADLACARLEAVGRQAVQLRPTPRQADLRCGLLGRHRDRQPARGHRCPPRRGLQFGLALVAQRRSGSRAVRRPPDGDGRRAVGPADPAQGPQRDSRGDHQRPRPQRLLPAAAGCERPAAPRCGGGRTRRSAPIDPALAALAAATVSCAAPATAQLAGDVFIHDPSTVVESDGKWYTFGTRGGGLVSSDGWTWSSGPIRPGGGVAPDVIRIGDRYYVAYAVGGGGLNGGHASEVKVMWTRSLDPNSPDFEYHEVGTVASSNGVENNDAIDPAFLFVDGRLWLTYGT